MSEGGQLASSRTRIWTRSPDGCSNTLSAHRKLSLKEHLKSSCLETKGSCELVFLAWLVEPQRSTVRLQVQKEERLWEHSKSRLESGRQLPLLEPLMEASLPVFITRYYRAVCREQVADLQGLIPRSKAGNQAQVPPWRKGSPLYLLTVFSNLADIEFLIQFIPSTTVEDNDCIS